jgi:hypothetical protein
MKTIATICAALAAAFLILNAGGCGKDSNGESTGQAEPAVESQQTEASLPTDAVPYDAVIQAAGFEVAYYNPFPASEAGRKGRMILYRSASGGKDGGAVFVEQWATTTQWVWHWYFKDTKPKTFVRLDINKDGLWDIVVLGEKGGQIDLVHDETFALLGKGRDDRIALNGSSSKPVDGHLLWRCFDGDFRTTWQSKIDASSPAFIEVASPMGLSDGILVIQAADEGQPQRCKLYADGDMVQDFELRATAEKQLVQPDPKVRAAKKIRLEILSCHGDCDSVAIAELQIR